MQAENPQGMGVGDITKAEPNVHGGTKYIRVLFDRYFKDANFDEQNRTLFVFASDNAGPSRIAKSRGEAKDHGLDADKWFNNTPPQDAFATVPYRQGWYWIDTRIFVRRLPSLLLCSFSH